MHDFINLKRPKNTTPGIAEKVWIALVEWFAVGGIKTPGIWLAPGDDVLIKEAHEFLPGKAFIECKLAPEKNNYAAASAGETGFIRFQNKVSVVLPGSYEELHDTIKELLNQPVIVLVQDSNCSENIMYQVGTECIPAYPAPTFTTGTTREGYKGYLIEISNQASKVYLYEGQIPGTPAPLIARINGSIVGSAVTVDGLDSTIYGTVHYQFTIYYNDVNDVRQTIVLPDDNFEASFDTAILANWNNAGLAVQLTITNEYTTDTTLSSDSTGQRPLHMGGFDEGFDDGFDFNK